MLSTQNDLLLTYEFPMTDIKPKGACTATLAKCPEQQRTPQCPLQLQALLASLVTKCDCTRTHELVSVSKKT